MKKKEIVNSSPVRSRRDFLKTGAAGAGALAVPWIIPASARGADGHTPPSERLTMGCIGMGGRGMGVMRGFMDRDDVRIVAVCDVDRTRLEGAKNVADEYYADKACDATPYFEEVCDHPDIDILGLMLPDHWHAIPAVRGLAAGKDIFGEKPLARTIAEGRAIADAVTRYGRVWQTGSFQRSVGHFRKACELVRNGRIGRLHTVEVCLGGTQESPPWSPQEPPEGFDYDRWLGPAPWSPYTPKRCHGDFRWVRDYSLGMLGDWGAHHVDIAHWGMDADRTGPVEIRARQGRFAADGLFDTAREYVIECKYESGVKMIIHDVPVPGLDGFGGTTFIGDEGWVKVSRGGFETNPPGLRNSVIGPDEIHLYDSPEHVEDFIQCVRERRDPITPAETAHRSITPSHLGEIAIALGRPLRYDPKREIFPDDPDASRLLSRPMRAPWRLEG